MGLFVSPVGPFWPPAPAVPVVGTTGGRRVSMLPPILGFTLSVVPGRRPCHLFTRSGGLAGGSCFSPPCWAAGSIRFQLLCHNFIRSRGPHR
jgi:hypothetical protein